MLARDVMTSPVVTVAPDTPVEDVATLLLERRISGVPVVDAGGKLVGILSEGDLLHRAETDTARRRSSWLQLILDKSAGAADFVKSHGRYARDVMSRDVVTASPDTELSEIAELMERHRIKRIPVLDGGTLVGIVSRANLLHGLVAYRRAVQQPVRSADDGEIRDRLAALLRDEDWIDTRNINIVVSNGTVHLWGVVDNEDQQRALRAAAEGIPGVRGVEEHFSPNWFANETG